MLTGYNTDVEHDGVVYHVQTEDKGLDNPVILSLVYTGGEILASKRSRYEDLIAAGLDEAVLAERLQRQHKLICAAIHSGRVNDLKRMGERAASEPRERDKAKESTKAAERDETRAPADKFSIVDNSETDNALKLALMEEGQLRAGDFVTLKVKVSRAAGAAETAVSGARVVLKTLGTSFKPASTFSITDKGGIALIFASLPSFETGRGAILLRAEAGGETAELRRVVLPA